MQKQILPLLLLIGFLVPQLAYGQAIYAPNANYSNIAGYGGGDSLFVFNEDNSSELYIIADTQSYPLHTIQWEKYNPGIGFELLGTDPKIAVSTSEATQGYRLTLNGVDTVISTCWVMINDFSVKVVTKDENDSILLDALSSSDCVWIGYIEVDYSRNPLIYYYPDSTGGYSYNLDLSYASEFSTDKTPDNGYGKMYEAGKLGDYLRFGINNSWWNDLKYTIEITDEAGLMRSDFLWVTAIRPHAEYTFEHIYLNDKEYFPDKDTLYYYWYDEDYNKAHKSAPGLYSFDGQNSDNADSLIWNFGHDTTLNTSQKKVPHEYTKYGTYQTSLKVVKYFDFRRECYDETDKNDKENQIVFDIPTLNAPNFITPPGGENPIWRYLDVSITDFEIAIYNRYGRRVHYFKGNVRDWGGWDGSFNKTSNYVSTGVYFYVLKDFSFAPLHGEATKDNTPVFDTDGGGVYNGAIHVFNTEQ